jgi:hypothetical protein
MPRPIPAPRRAIDDRGRIPRFAPLELPAADIRARTDRLPRDGGRPPVSRPPGEELEP